MQAILCKSILEWVIKKQIWVSRLGVYILLAGKMREVAVWKAAEG